MAILVSGVLFVGLVTMGVVTPGAGGAPVAPGDLHDPAVLVGVAGAAGFVGGMWAVAGFSTLYYVLYPY